MSKILISGAGKRDPRDFHAAQFRIVREMSLSEQVMYRNDKEALKRLVMNRYPMLVEITQVGMSAAMPDDEDALF